MNALDKEPLAKHLPPRLTEARLARQYAAVTSRVRPRVSWRALVPVGMAVGAAMAALLLVIGLHRGAAPQATWADGTTLESPASGAGPAVTLADGSRVSLGASSRVRLSSTRADAIRVDLERGRVDVQATHVEKRTFVVGARGWEVNVVGTRFTVEADGPVRVHVDEGRVRVHPVSGGPDVFVSGGEEWVEAPGAEAAPSGSATTASEDEDDGGDDDASDGTGVRGPRRSSGPSAKALLEDAQQAMAQGRAQDAARMFDSIRRDHRRDPRAALAAFELGRLRLDVLHDATGAESAFRDALALARDAGLRDDAEARHVEALGAMGAQAACVKARDAYLARHARGVHRADVASRCGGT